jgi:hypothetical protein
VTEFEKSAREKEEGLKQRKADREEKSAAMKEWKELDDARKVRNKEIRSDYDARVKAWEVERDIAKEEHRRPRWKKPTLKGLLFSALPKPNFGVGPGEKAVERDSDVEESNGEASVNGGDDGSENSDNDPPSPSEDESASEPSSDGSGE